MVDDTFALLERAFFTSSSARNGKILKKAARLNNIMSTVNNSIPQPQSANLNAKTGKPKVSSRGGARANAGRPKGSADKFSVTALLDAVTAKTGQNYVDLLIDDFNTARANQDGHLVNKYHNLILNKLAASLTAVEVTDSQDALAQRQAAFAAAIAKIAAATK